MQTDHSAWFQDAWEEFHHHMMRKPTIISGFFTRLEAFLASLTNMFSTLMDHNALWWLSFWHPSRNSWKLIWMWCFEIFLNDRCDIHVNTNYLKCAQNTSGHPLFQLLWPVNLYKIPSLRSVMAVLCPERHYMRETFWGRGWAGLLILSCEYQMANCIWDSFIFEWRK